MASFSIAVEGPSDSAVARRLCEAAGHSVHREFVTNGKAQLDRSLPGYNNAARFSPWLILRDLDRDADCAPALLPQLLLEPAEQMCFRIAVRQMEAWLIADAEELARFVGVARDSIPDTPDALSNPKLSLINIARRSRRRDIRQSWIPEEGVSSITGAGYTASVIDFIRNRWRVKAAAERSPSLRRALQALQRFVGR